MRTSAPGSERPPAGAVRQRGFTLIELMIVVALVAVASAVAVLALRDPAATRLEREAVRLAALLESARAEARALGMAVRWVPAAAEDGGGFRFVGLPATLELPTQWLGEGMSVDMLGPRGRLAGVQLGPEPVITAQRIVLRLDAQRLTLATDGLGPFEVIGDDDAAAQAALR